MNPELQQVSPQELANRYYAAFPPLNRNTLSTSPTKLISLIPKWIPSPKKNRKHNQETMKATRTAGKQRFGAYFTNRNNNNNKKEVVRQNEKKSRSEPIAKPDWNMEETNLYDDLPVDIKELLDDSPTSHDVTVAMMNLANMRDTGRRGFIPCGTNITSSIWTNEAAMEEDNTLFDNNFNTSVHDSVLDLQFSSITINNNWENDDFSFVKENERNTFFEQRNTTWELPNGRWSDDSGCFEDDHHFSLSLVKLNHDKKVSAFAEVVPKGRSNFYNPFSKIIGSGIHRDTSLKKIDLEKEKDDLLTSIHSHFRPINEKVDYYLQGKYADGATFLVSNSWDKINYRRTESGMYMENDYQMRKKYCEYGPTNMEFVLKYLVCQNDKGCQTEDVDAEVEAINSDRESTCTCRTLNVGDCLVHPNDVWQQQPCDKCNNNTWNLDGLKDRNDLGWQFGTMSKIWSGGSVCHSCLGRPPSTRQHTKLREDVSQDGDQLLSDIKSFMQECDITEFFLPKERKRRHSLMATQLEDSWSFASRLEEDCLIQMSTIPTLRSVTL